MPSAQHSRSHSPSDFDTSHDDDARSQLKVRGLLPPHIESYELQKARCLEQINQKSNPIDKYTYLSNLRNTNTNLFYRLLMDHMKEITPLVYTPVVGEACLQWSHIYTQPEGLYLSYADRGNLRAVIDNWPAEKIDITVVTDGSRILGLGDLGVNGMGIPVGKLALYTGCAGIHPDRTLPITLDLGTENAENLNDPLYLGAKMHRVSEAESLEFLDEMMIALNDKWPGLVVQFEDFKNPFPSLERYRNTYTCFNDDIQGTGAVILSGMINALKLTGVPFKDQKLVFMGAGSAAVGVAKQIVQLFIKGGVPEHEARKMFWLVDSRGLVTNDRGDKLQEHKVYFSRDDNQGQQYESLEEVVDYVRPTALLGLCTIGGVFTESILRKMADFNDRPIVFPLSNPSSKSECTFEQAMKYTNNKAIFASGSPFPEVEADGVTYYPGQGNNMYVFPGIGLGSVLCESVHVTQEMIYASAVGLADSLTEEERAKDWLYPSLERIRDISVRVARYVIRASQSENLDKNKTLQWLSDVDLDAHIKAKMYNPAHEHSPTAGSPTRELHGFNVGTHSKF
jgi:malate dehydrogenase (oxaloacetate-decarboxylating)(NADP+)